MALKLNTAPTGEPVTLAEAKAHLREDLVDVANDALITNLIVAARMHAENVCRRAFITQKWDLYLDAFPLQSYYGILPGFVPPDQLPNGWMAMRNYAVRFRGGRIDLPFPSLVSVDAIKYRANTAETGIATAAGAASLTLAAAASAVDSFYNGAALQIIAGTGAGQANSVISYAGATKVATVGPWDVLPDASSQYSLTGVLTTLSPARYTVDAISEPGIVTPAVGSYWPGTVNVTNAVQISYTSGYGAAAAVPAPIKAWMLLRIGALYENREEFLTGRSITVAELPFADGLLDPVRIRNYV
jgi:hypothetical protein